MKGIGGVVRVWSKEAGLGPAGVGLRGFKPHTPHSRRDLLELRGALRARETKVSTPSLMLTIQ